MKMIDIHQKSYLHRKIKPRSSLLWSSLQEVRWKGRFLGDSMVGHLGTERTDGGKGDGVCMYVGDILGTLILPTAKPFISALVLQGRTLRLWCLKQIVQSCTGQLAVLQSDLWTCRPHPYPLPGNPPLQADCIIPPLWNSVEGDMGRIFMQNLSSSCGWL